MWAKDYSVPLGGWTYLYIWWEDVGCSEYYIVLYETYPDGTTRRYPPQGFYGPYPAPGPYRALQGKFIGDVAGKHCLYFQVYCYSYCLGEYELICTSNTICINVVKEKKASTITVSVSPSRIERGDTVEITGCINPGVQAQVTLTIVSPSGRQITRNTLTSATGCFSYTFSPDEVGEWRVQASWAGNEDYLGATSDWASFSVESRKYLVTVSTVPSGLPVVVDGVEYHGSMTFQWDEGSYHTLFVQQFISAGSDKRYIFKQWSDGTTSTSRTITVTSPANYQAIFEVQYLVSVNTDYGDVSGVGWYKEGEQARVKLETPIVQLDEGTRVVFTGWSGDIRGTDTEVWIRVDKGYTLIAGWKKQYRVIVTTDISEAGIEGGEWQDEGATARVYVSQPRLGFVIEDVFNGFKVLSGECQVIMNDLEEGASIVKVNGPCTLKAEWKKDYTKLIVILVIIIICTLIIIKKTNIIEKAKMLSREKKK